MPSQTTWKAAFACSLAATMLCLFSLSACGGGKSGAEALQPEADSGLAGLELPLPSELPKIGSVIPPDSSRALDGMQILLGTNHNMDSSLAAPQMYNWSAIGGDARYSPNFSGSQGPLSQAAYALYSLAGFTNESGPQEVHVDWYDASAAADCWVGLANVELDRWDWFKLPASETFTVSDIAPYLSDAMQLGRIGLAVVLLGNTPRDLDHLVVGGPITPLPYMVADLDSDQTLNLAPRTVNFSLSVNMAGCEFESVDFDLDGQPGFEITGDTDGSAQFEYASPGVYTAKGRLHDDLGRSFDFERTFTIVNPANQAPVASVAPTASSGDAPLEVVFDASLSSDPDGTILRYRWDVDADGEWDFDTGNTPYLSRTLGIQGQRFFVVEVMDNDFAVDTASSFVTMNSGWKAAAITDADVTDLDTAVIGTGASARFCCLFQDYADGKYHLRFVKASNAAGSSWGNVLTLVDGSGLGEVGHEPRLLTLADGRVLAIWGEENDQTGDYMLRYARSTDTSGSTWTATGTIRSDDAGYHNQLAMINGFPAVLTARGGASTNNAIFYLASDDVQGGSWPTEHEVAYGGQGHIVPTGLIQGAGAPVASIARNGFGDGFQTIFACAADMSGASWNTMRSIEGDYLGSGGMVYLGNGKLCFGGSFEQDGAPVDIFLGEPVDFDWTGPQQLITGDYPSGGDLSIARIGSLPAVAFHSWASNDLMYSQSLIADGTQFQAPYEVWTMGKVGNHCSMTGANSEVTICFSNETDHQLMGAWYQH